MFSFKKTKKATQKAIAGYPRKRKLNRKLKKEKAQKLADKRKPVGSAWSIAKKSVKLILKNWMFFGVLMLVYMAMNIIFASGISDISNNITNIKDLLSSLRENNYQDLSSSAVAFLQLVGTAGSSSTQGGQIFQAFLFVIQSLVIIWSVRYLSSGQKIKVKQAFYSSTAQLIPFLLVLAMIIIQCIPLLIGMGLYSDWISNGLAVTAEEKILFIAISLLLGIWSIRMLGSSIFGMYIVTLPEMKPIESLRRTRNLVRFRRALLIRKLLFLPIIILLIMALVIMPLIIYATSFAAPAFFILGALALLFAHTYLYSLYKELIA